MQDILPCQTIYRQPRVAGLCLRKRHTATQLHATEYRLKTVRDRWHSLHQHRVVNNTDKSISQYQY